jgi:hypothetical protein
MRWWHSAKAWIAGRVCAWADSTLVTHMRRLTDEHSATIRAKDEEAKFKDKVLALWKNEVDLIQAKLEREYARAKCEKELFIERSLPQNVQR